MRCNALRDGNARGDGSGLRHAGEMMAASMDSVRAVRVINIRDALIARGRIVRVARVLHGVVVHAGPALVALESEPRHRRRLHREPGEQHQQD